MSQSTRTSVCVLLFGAVCCSAQVSSPTQPVLQLTLQKAIEIATSTRGNATVLLAQEAQQLTRSRYIQARASLLPSLDASVAEQNQTVNPRALGLRFSSPLFTVPDEVGPFNTFDARLRLNANVLDVSSIRRWQAAREDVQAAGSETDSSRERVSATVARLYAIILRAEARVQAAKTNLTETEALLDLASHRATVGEGTELDVSRAELNVSRERQRVLVADTEHSRAELDLIAALRANWNTILELAGTLDSANAEIPTPAESMATALQARADFKVEEKRIASANLNHNAARMERMPSLAVYGDYGDLQGVPTHTVGVALRVPVFDGGRIGSDELAAVSVLRQEQIRQEELKNEVQLQIRKALASLRATSEQVKVADQAIGVAQDELGRAQRRYASGVTNSAEIIEAQSQLEVARDDRVEALFNFANARIDWAEATGTVTKLTF